jgi:predicted MPP superfamily phosphohydrolase
VIHGDEVLAVLLFVGAVGFVFVAAAFALLRRFVFRPPRPINRFGKIVTALAAVGALCVLYGRFVEPRWIEVTTTRIETKRLARDHRGVRIVHLSDIHSEETPLVEERLPALVAGLRPDLIVFTGDAVNEPQGAPVFRRCLTDLAKIAPTFCVKGNWDAGLPPDVELFRGTGARELDGTSAAVDVAGAQVRIVGAGFFSDLAGLSPALAALPADGPAVLLYHCPYPDVIPARFASRVDLMCAGHVHGGQVALPVYGALLTLSKFGKKFERGLYRLDEGPAMYVSRGIGMQGGGSPRVRFCARPEVALIELVPSAE